MWLLFLNLGRNLPTAFDLTYRPGDMGRIAAVNLGDFSLVKPLYLIEIDDASNIVFSELVRAAAPFALGFGVHEAIVSWAG